MTQSTNGSFSITRNGEPVSGCRWSARQFLAAVRYFRALSSTDGHKLPPRKYRAPAVRTSLPRTYRAAIETWDSEGGAMVDERDRARRRNAMRRYAVTDCLPDPRNLKGASNVQDL